MYLLHEKMWTYIGDRQQPEKVTPARIRKDTSDGHCVRSFEDLTSRVATLGFLNVRYFLLFRGQSADYHTGRDTVSLYPTIYRDEPGTTDLTPSVQVARFQKLKAIEKELNTGYRKHVRVFSKELQRLNRHQELRWAILQHYDLVHTPYLDVTSSLRVAASFALSGSQRGYVYVLALPYPTGSITHVVDEDVKIVRLQAACPPSAKRPHFQDGFLIGSCYIDPEANRANQNASRRLVAKFFIPDRDSFWVANRFDPIPNDALFPSQDEDFQWLGSPGK